MMLLKTYQSRLKLSDRAMADQIGVAQSTITRYHTGRFPTIELIIRIAKVTDGKVCANDHVRAYCDFHGITVG